MLYLLKLLKTNMQNRNIFKESLHPRYNSNGTYNYQSAIEALNTLQSNAEYLKNRRNETPENSTHEALRSNCIDKMLWFLNRSDIEVHKLKSVIHVAGTKGKGSTCAFCESILRHHGYKTGFFSSPHLVNVTERIRINGEAIENEQFAKTFWEIYLELRRTNPLQMPIYFQMLTLIAFKLFLQEDCDVAVVEVGIGGEYDTTNVISQCQVVGITSLGLDHTTILGNSIEQIAWHKAGIMKKECRCFSMPQVDAAMKILKERSEEIQCSLEVVNPKMYENISQNNIMPRDVYQLNTSLAIKLAESWLAQNKQRNLNFETVNLAIANCHWPGRFQIIKTPTINFYLDGAHTTESINYCANWYMDKLNDSSFHGNGNITQSQRALIFNSTGDRDVDMHLQILHHCGFHKVYFVPNVCVNIASSTSSDNVNHNFPASEQLIKCTKNMSHWCELFPKDAGLAYVMPSVCDAIEELINTGSYHQTLITGSLHLIGSTLQVLESKADRNTSLGKELRSAHIFKHHS